MTAKKVLFLGADPTGGTFAIDVEFAQVQAELRACGRGAFQIEFDLDVQPNELQRLLNQYSPELLHFSGHVTEEGALTLVDRQDRRHFVPPTLVKEILSLASRPIRCLVLNACNGERLAAVLTEVAEVIVAMKGAVTVRSAQTFSTRFYEGLAGGRTVRDAFNQGLVEAKLAGYGTEIDAELVEQRPGLADAMTFSDGAHSPTPRAAPTPDVAPERSGIFISYSHKDNSWMKRMRTMLQPLERSRSIEVWDDERRIAAGTDWADEIDRGLKRARVGVLLVSRHFLASEFIHEKELPAILAARQEGLLDVLWVYLSPCLVSETELDNIQAAHRPMAALTSMTESEQEDALLQVANKIAEILRK